MAAGLLLPAVLSAAPPAPAAERPNIIFILADDLGWRDTGAYGSRFYRTPNIDRLAAAGTRFTQAYAANPLCSPTRASIMTGQYPARLRFTTPAGHLPQVVLDPRLPERGPAHHKAVTPATRTRLPLEYVTLAEILRARGYRTGHFGKWHLGREPYMPEQQGFDLNVGGGPYPGPPSYFSPYRNEKLTDGPKGEHVTDRLTAEAIKFLEENRERPFFLNFWQYSVHAPFQAEEELIEKYRKLADPADPQRNPMMGAMIEALDRSVGRIWESVRRLGLERKTLIVFTSDNGGNMYDRLGEGLPPTNNAPLRGGKATIYEGGVRVPLAVVWPGKIRPGAVSTAQVSSIDWFPTLAAAAGAAPSPGQTVDGINLLPLFTRGRAPSRSALFCHFPHYTPATGNRPATSVRRGDWKLIRFYADGEDQQDRYELYNLADDLGEARNLAGREPERVKSLNALITEHLRKTEALVPKPNPAYKPTTGGWLGNERTELRIAEGRLAVRSNGQDPFLTTSEVKPGRGPYAFELQIRAPAGGEARLYWTARRQPLALGRSVAFQLEKRAEPKHYQVAIPETAPLSSLRLDPGSGPGQWEIDWMRLRDAAGEVTSEWRFDGGLTPSDSLE